MALWDCRNVAALQYLHRNPCTRFCVRQGMVMVRHRTAAGGCYGVQLVVGETLAEVPVRGATGAVELVVGIVHLINIEYRPQAAFVKRAVVCHQWQTLNQRLDLLPHLREQG